MLSYLLKCRGVNGFYCAFIMAGVTLSNLPPVINIILTNGQCRDQWFGTLQSCTFTTVYVPIDHFVDTQTPT